MYFLRWFDNCVYGMRDQFLRPYRLYGYRVGDRRIPGVGWSVINGKGEIVSVSFYRGLMTWNHIDTTFHPNLAGFGKDRQGEVRHGCQTKRNGIRIQINVNLTVKQSHRWKVKVWYITRYNSIFIFVRLGVTLTSPQGYTNSSRGQAFSRLPWIVIKITIG